MATAKENENDHQSDETFEFLCSPCKRKDKNTEAFKYCVDCNDYYCYDCVYLHNSFPALSGHKLLDKVESGSESSLPLAPTERCEKHRFKLVDMYCENHDEVGCCTCMSLDHRTCKDIFDIPEYVRNKNTISEEDQITADLQNLTAQLEEKITVCIKSRKILLKKKEDALVSLCHFRKEIIERLNELEKNTRALIDERYIALMEIIEKDIMVLKNSKKEVESAVENFVLSGSNASQRFVCSKKGKLSAKNAARCSKESITGEKEMEYYFAKQKKLVKCFEEINSLGKFSRNSNALYVIAKKKQYNIRHKSDLKPCSIISACVLEDGSTILADSTNKKLKRMNRTYSIVDVYGLSLVPWQICLSDKDTVAVLFQGGKSIHVIAVRDKMRLRNKIMTNHLFYGIAAAQGYLYVTDSFTGVTVYSMSGIKLNEFPKDQSGERLFTSIYGLAVSGDGMRIYVTDETNGLVILNKDGILQDKYRSEKVRDARRLCVADNGTVLVSCGSNNCILQFTSDGKELGNVMISDTENERCDAICFIKDSLIVGRPGEDEIDLYCLY